MKVAVDPTSSHRWIIVSLLVLGTPSATAGRSISADFELQPVALTAGGGWASSAHYQNLPCLEATGSGSSGSEAYTTRFGFVPASVPSEVAGRFVFYNQSAWDGNSAAADSLDDAAIASDKAALRPGQTASFNHYTSYSRGLNGIMVDLPLGGTPTASDFQFRMGNNNNPGAWPFANAPTVIAVRPGAGVAGADRVSLVWDASTSVKKQWLEVTVRATSNTGLAAPDTFYFGNAIGETGNSSLNAQVDLADQIGARNNPHNFLSPAPLQDAYDFDRNRRVDLADEILARNHSTTFLTALRLIQPEGSGASPALAGPSAQEATWLGTAIPNSEFPFTVSVEGAFLALEVPASLAGVARLESTSDLAGRSWEPLAIGPSMSSDRSAFRWRLPVDRGVPHRFFRISVESPTPVSSR